MKEPMLTAVENAIAAAITLSIDTEIPPKEMNAAVKVAALATLAAMRTPTEAMIEAGASVEDHRGIAISVWEYMIDAAMQGA